MVDSFPKIERFEKCGFFLKKCPPIEITCSISCLPVSNTKTFSQKQLSQPGSILNNCKAVAQKSGANPYDLGIYNFNAGAVEGKSIFQ
jgi:hypothetical protein